MSLTTGVYGLAMSKADHSCVLERMLITTSA